MKRKIFRQSGTQSGSIHRSSPASLRSSAYKKTAGFEYPAVSLIRLHSTTASAAALGIGILLKRRNPLLAIFQKPGYFILESRFVHPRRLEITAASVTPESAVAASGKPAGTFRTWRSLFFDRFIHRFTDRKPDLTVFVHIDDF